MQLGVQTVTVYAFSIDNFRRTKSEVDMLMNLFREKLEFLSQERYLLPSSLLLIFFAIVY